MGVGSPGYFVGLTVREELQQARRHIKNVLDNTGIGENPPLTHLQHERLEDADKEIAKVLKTIPKNKYKKRK